MHYHHHAIRGLYGRSLAAHETFCVHIAWHEVLVARMPPSSAISHSGRVSEPRIVPWLRCRKDDVFLSYLPLAHIFDRVAEETFLCIGGKIGYWQGSVKKLMDDVAALRPTIFVGVPRIFDRIYTGVSDKVCIVKMLIFVMYCVRFNAAPASQLYSLFFPHILVRYP